MIPFPTSPEEVTQVKAVAAEMVRSGLDFDWVVAVAKVAKLDQGAFALMKLWHESDSKTKSEIIADLQDTLDDYVDAPPEPTERPKIPFEDLDPVTRQILAEKKKLRALIERHGGVSAVARRCGIPQPSLSRMLNSASMPRRSTLYRIAVSVGIPEAEIVTEWTR